MSQDTHRDRPRETAPSILPTFGRRAIPGALLTLALLLALLTPLISAAQGEPPNSQIHITIAGETLPGIAARYGVSVLDLARANNLTAVRSLRAGTRLVVPAPPGQTGKTHIVRRNETIQQLALRYDVSVQDILLANNLASPDYVFIGQRLLIPVVEPPLMPTPPPVSTPIARPTAAAPVCASNCETLTIISPTYGMTITSPLLVAGLGSAADGELVLRVLDASGFEIGLGSAAASAAPGSASPFSGTVTYAVPASSQLGRLQVYSVDRRDGAIEHLASVVVALPGAGLDEAILTLQEALQTKDYDAIQSLLAEQWTLGFFRSEGLALTADQSLRQLRQSYLGPGDVTVDLSVDARKLLGEAVIFSSDVTHVIYSTGWGPDAADDALLLFATDDAGQTRWTGMLYIYDGMREYERP